MNNHSSASRETDLPSFSVVIPSYNQSSFIRETIESVLSQDYKPLEVIVVDGGSIDGTVDILKQLGDRVRWISEKDQGQADAVNKGWRMASGNILGWLNSDDLYEPGALKTVGRFFSNRPDSSSNSWAPVHLE